MSALTYRFLSSEDARMFRQFRLGSFEESPDAFFFTRQEKEDKPLAYWEALMEKEHVLGAFDGGQIVGCASLRLEEGVKLRHRAYLGSVYVAPQARGRGVARAMMEKLLEKAKALRLELVRLSTKVNNPVSVGLYRSLGFEEYGVEKKFLKLQNGDYVDEVLMIKFLE